MEVKAKVVFVAEDETEFYDHESCGFYESILNKVEKIQKKYLSPLPDTEKNRFEFKSGKLYIRQDPDKVEKYIEEIDELIRREQIRTGQNELLNIKYDPLFIARDRYLCIDSKDREWANFSLPSKVKYFGSPDNFRRLNNGEKYYEN